MRLSDRRCTGSWRTCIRSAGASTGDGLRETLRRIGDRIPLEIHEVPSGTEVLDWTVPKEWNVREAHVDDPNGRRVVDFREHSLHVVGRMTRLSRQFTVPWLPVDLASGPSVMNVEPAELSPPMRKLGPQGIRSGLKR